MVETAGTKLRRMRILRQLSLEDVARVTRISIARLADLEADEYSNFPNVAYAKGFLRAYGKFLNVDLKSYLEGFEAVGSFGLDDYQYLSEKPVGVYRIPRRPQQRPKFRRKRLLATAGLLGVLTIVAFGWFLYVTAQRLGGDMNKLAEHQEARAHGTTRSGEDKSFANTPSPTPEGLPATSDSMGRELVALTLAQSSPSAVLSQFSVPAANVPILPMSADQTGNVGAPVLRSMVQKPLLVGSGSNSGNPLADAAAVLPAPGGVDRSTGVPVPAPGGTSGNLFYVHMLDKNSVDIFRTGVPHPPKPAGNTLE